MTTTKICTCEHKWQDDRYGQQRRVMNQTQKDKNGNSWRCTVCGKEH